MDENESARVDGWRNAAERDAYEADYWTEALTEALQNDSGIAWKAYRDYVEKREYEAWPQPPLPVKAFAHLAGKSTDAIRDRLEMFREMGLATKADGRNGRWLIDRKALEHLNDKPATESTGKSPKRRKKAVASPDSEVW